MSRSKPSKTHEKPAKTLEVSSYEGQAYDKLLTAAMSKYLGPISPISYAMAIMNWLAHLQVSPAKQVSIVQKSYENAMKFLLYSSAAQTTGCKACIEAKS